MRSFFLIVLLSTPILSLRLAQYDMEDPQEGLELYTRRAVKAGVLPDQNLGDDEYYSQLREFIKSSCGVTCEYSQHEGKGKFFGTVSKPDVCASLFSEKMMALDSLSTRLPPPKEVPKAMRADFNMGDEALTIDSWYIDDTLLAKGEQTKRLLRWQAKWQKENIEASIKRIKSGDYHTGYSIAETRGIYDALMAHKSDLEGKHCAVLGSQRPWLEVLLLTAGVKKVTTIEYTDLKSTHPQLDSLHPSDWDKLYAKGELFDCAISYSSLEHAGLGRYGDIVNPWGDMIAMGKMGCSTKPGGLVLIGYPVRKDGQAKDTDGVAWNAHRYYGEKRWPQMLANTEQLYKQEGICYGGVCQGFVVARKL